MAERPLSVGVKYCGGCNPRFDRVGFVQRLAAAFPATSFSPARQGVCCEALLVVCGCTARCAGLAGLEDRLGRLTVCSDGDFPAAAAFLRRAGAN